MTFETWTEAYKYQQSKFSYGNDLEVGFIPEVLDVAFALPKSNILSVIMAEDFNLGDYEENATIYGIHKDGRWTALSDSHCS